MAKRAKVKKATGVTVADLKDKYNEGGRVFLFCDVCGAEYSATKGDYWNHPSDHVFTCDHGGEEGNFGDFPETPMRLVRKECRFVDLIELVES